MHCVCFNLYRFLGPWFEDVHDEPASAIMPNKSIINNGINIVFCSFGCLFEIETIHDGHSIIAI